MVGKTVRKKIEKTKNEKKKRKEKKKCSVTYRR
jgi:hypothetical protein